MCDRWGELKGLMYSSPRNYAIAGLAVSVIIFVAGCGQAPPPLTEEPPESGRRYPGTSKMIERLKAITDKAFPRGNPFLNAQRAAYLVGRRIPDEPSAARRHLYRLAREQVRAGQTEAGLETISMLESMMDREAPPGGPDFRRRLRSLKAIAYLRLGEQDNCISRHHADACIFPITAAGHHTIRRGSTNALAEYVGLLREDSSDISSRWLANLAMMTLGMNTVDIPDGIAIPAETFQSDCDFPRFPDVAPAMGANVVGLAGGCVAEDFNGDGFIDIMCSSWGLQDQLVYLENVNGTHFEDKTEAAGLRGLSGGLNMAQADYNNDGFVDVFILRGAWLNQHGRHPDSLLRNNGDGTFEDVTETAGLLNFSPTQTAAWCDYDNDGWLDIFIGNESHGNERHPSRLYRNHGDGTFRDATSKSGLAIHGYVKGVVWGDIDNDGWSDLYVSRLLEPNLLYRNMGGAAVGDAPTFRDITESAGVGEPIRSFPTWMFDYDNDGWLDIFVSGYDTNYLTADIAAVVADYLGLATDAERPRLYRNNGDGTFFDVTRDARLHRVLYTMGCNYGDLDNDGFLDFYLGTGAPDLRALMPNRMFRNYRGQYFQDVTTAGGFGHIQKGHGISFADFDNDGDQDIYAVMGGAYSGDVYPNLLFQNPGNAHKWVVLQLEGTRSNRDGIGARIKLIVRTGSERREIYANVNSGGSFGASSLRRHVGLGPAEALESVHVTWPGSSRTQQFDNVAMNRRYLVREDDAALRSYTLTSRETGP